MHPALKAPGAARHPAEGLDVQENADDDDGNCAPRARAHTNAHTRRPALVWAKRTRHPAEGLGVQKLTDNDSGDDDNYAQH
jgi:hypothetical protein